MVDLDDLVCGVCGVAAVQGREKWLHVEELPEKAEPHDVENVVSRRDYLFGVETARAENRSPLERQASALERIATAVERIADRT